ncbi:MAG: hypothetical protein JO027_16990 [Solirubrobacterales bacterium]|nr:hypothetical protein [Solirubrobacterales bacterium]
MKRNRAVLATAAAVAASAVATVTFAPGAQAWDRCPPGNHDREYCEHHHHHHHHHHHGDGRAADVRRE